MSNDNQPPSGPQWPGQQPPNNPYGAGQPGQSSGGNEPTQQFPAVGNEPTQQLPNFGGQPGQYGQPSANQPYGQPSATPQPGQYGQPQYGQQQPGQYGQQQPGQPGQYGQQPGQYGQQQPGQYGQQPGQYGQQQPGQYGQQPRQYGQGQPGSTNRTPLLIAVAAALVVALAIGGYFLFRPDKTTDANPPATATAPTNPAPTTNEPTQTETEPETTAPSEPESTEPSEPETSDEPSTQTTKQTGERLPAPTDPVKPLIGTTLPAEVGDWTQYSKETTFGSKILIYANSSKTTVASIMPMKDSTGGVWSGTSTALLNPVKIKGGYCGTTSAGNSACMIKSQDELVVLVSGANTNKLSPADLGTFVEDFVAALK